MKKFLPIVLISTLALAGCGPSAERLVNDGNEAFAKQDYAGALAAYQQAQAESPELAEPHFNTANTLYRQENYEEALKEIEQTLIKDDGGLVQDSFYNLGNSFFQGQELEQAVEAYKEALRLNPDDVEAKHNLELALQQQQHEQQDQQQQQNEQQEQQQNEDQNQDQQNQDQQNEQNQQQEQQQNEDQNQQQEQQQNESQDQNQDQQNQDQQNQDQQNEQEQQQNESQEQSQGQQNQDQRNENQKQNQDQQNQDQQNEQEQQQNESQEQSQGQQNQDQQDDPQPGNGQPQQVQGLTQEQARQLLEAAAQDTESLEEHLQQILVAPGGQPAKDW